MKLAMSPAFQSSVFEIPVFFLRVLAMAEFVCGQEIIDRVYDVTIFQKCFQKCLSYILRVR